MSQINPDTQTCEILIRVPPLDRLVVLIRVRHDVAHEFTVFGDDIDVVVDDVEPDAFAMVLPSHVEVTQLTYLAQSDVSALVDDVVTDAV